MNGAWKTYLGMNKGKCVVDVRSPDGRRRRFELSSTSKDAAREEYRAWVAQVLPKLQRDWDRTRQGDSASEDVAPGDNPLIGTVTSYYVETFLPMSNAKERSIHKARQVLRDFELWCGEQRIGRVQQIGRVGAYGGGKETSKTARPIDRYQADLMRRKSSAKTVHNYIGTVRACLNAAVEGGLIAKSPVAKFIMPRVPDVEKNVLTEDEIRAMLATLYRVAPEIYAPVAWVTLTGNRPSDVVDLRWGQVNLETAFVTRTQVKVSKLAKFPIPAAAVRLLKTLASRGSGQQHVFVNGFGRPLTVNGLYKQFTRALEAAEFTRRVTLLDLRSSYATLQANHPTHPMPIQMLQVVMGHARIETTLKYLHNYDARQYVDRWGEDIKADRPALKLLNKGRG